MLFIIFLNELSVATLPGYSIELSCEICLTYQYLILPHSEHCQG